jgi:glutamate synthase domain-containing protein 2/glutamate synthase domain-containing protein 1/glutamate synthase domain-containing protein 3
MSQPEIARSLLHRPHAACGVGVLVDLQGRASHALVEQGLDLLANLDHRGARGAEEQTGDGAGMLLQKPHALFAALIPGLPPADGYGVAQCFLPHDAGQRAALQTLIEAAAAAEGMRLLAWRDVPTDHRELGNGARAAEPAVVQAFFAPFETVSPSVLDIRLYVLRRVLEKAVAAQATALDPEGRFYFCSLHRRKLVYKGLLTPTQLRSYYPDLSDPRLTTALALVHSRFSTNTLGAWDLAHPYRAIVHNGEINTLRGNLNWMQAREADLACPRLGAAIDKIRPVTGEGLSDTAVFDQVLELLVETGRPLAKALRMMVPEAWEQDAEMAPARRDFYDYCSTLMEPWDGPALVAASDGEQVAAILDRNGLRPCRYWITRDHRLIMASETGVLEVPPGEILVKARLRPGQLLLVDTATRRIVPETEIFDSLSDHPYGAWLAAHRVRLADRVETAEPPPPVLEPQALRRLQRAFGVTSEQLDVMLRPMATSGKDPIGSMGSDTPPAALSTRGPSLFDYFNQLFAQVSNPPIDFLRETLVTSLACYVGRRGNLLEDAPAHCRQLWLVSPVLTTPQRDAIHDLDIPGLCTTTIPITYPPDAALADAVAALCIRVDAAVAEGYALLLLSDRDIGPERLAIPSLLAVTAVHHHLIRRGLRTRVALLLDSGEPRLVHHLCTLVGYGADAVHPWLAYAAVAQLCRDGVLEMAPQEGLDRYRRALEQGLLKVMSKMGISTLASYKGAQVFEAVGLARDLVDRYFSGTRLHLPGVGLERLEGELRERHRLAFGARPPASLALESGGEYAWRRDGEWHEWNPYTIGRLQQAARNADWTAYADFAAAVNDQSTQPQTVRGLLEFATGSCSPVPLAQVEPAEAILRRFATGSMSFGSLSQEAHEALAVAMNRLGGIAGSGEGGEQVARFGTERECSMKQVASGRFGVTIEYLAHARQIEIKMAQGAKPGEGGELPGAKVDAGIAAVRFTTPGVGLISPPPHHDIYSIEDLAQLIHDLKCANPEAEIHVKLVSIGGVGTIAAGVAKARADAVLISGDSGGTGASLKTSIKSAGSPWELGLAETHQVLMENNLRSRIRVRVDGGLKTGRDVVIAALLGAEQYGFGTAALISLGCIMLRKCHCNTCSVGVATQDPRLRARFAGKPQHVINYLTFVAREVRELMARLGVRRMDELIGRRDLLRPRQSAAAPVLDLTALLHLPQSQDTPRKNRAQDHHLDRVADRRLIEQARSAIDHRQPVRLQLAVRNRDRAIGTMLSGAVAHRHGGRGLPDDCIRIDCTGSAGQSFAAFLARGISLHLEGDANDYIGKGLSGGRVSVRVPRDCGFDPARNVIVGNVALYGATAGEAYFNGLAGERFAVRNSGALAVVEGVGDHACEYMTGGTVLVLGPTGRNFGAGMSGGEAYVHDPEGQLAGCINPETVQLEPLYNSRDIALTRRLLENHAAYTASPQACALLADWERSWRAFVKVVPQAYAEVIAGALAEGRDIRMPLPPPANARWTAAAAARGPGG